MAKLIQPKNLEQLEAEAISVIRSVKGTSLIPKIQYHNDELKLGISKISSVCEKHLLLVKQNKQLLLEFMHEKLKHLKQEQHHLEQLFNSGKSNSKEYSSFINSDLAIRQIYYYNTCINYPNICSGYYGCHGCTDLVDRQEEIINYVR